MSAVAHADAVLARLQTTELDTYDTVPQNPPFPYAEVIADLGRHVAPRLHGRSKRKAWRVMVRVVGSTKYEARAAYDVVSEALYGHRLVVDGVLCTPCGDESSEPVDLDDPDVPGVYSGHIVWTFASTAVA